MALTKTPIELSSTPSIVDGGNATAITIGSDESTTFSGPIQLTAGALAAAGNAGLSHRSADNKLYLQAGTGGFNILDDQQNTHFAIDSAGAISIGSGASISPDADADNLVIQENGAAGITIGSSTSSVGSIRFADSGSPRAGMIYYNHVGNEMRFYTTETERMRIDGSGNFIVGSTNPAPVSNNVVGVSIRNFGEVQMSTNNQGPLYLNRKGSDGTLVTLRKENVDVGSIGNSGTRFVVHGTHTSGAGIYFGSNVLLPTNNAGALSDGAVSLGQSNYKYNTLFATSGSINTSDANEKQDIEELSDAEKRVAVAAKGLLRKYRWKDSVEAKGNNARIHFGIIAQDLQDAFTAEGLDAARYGMWCSDTWWETQTEVAAVEATEDTEAVDAYTRTDTYDTAEEAPEGATERTRLGVRYSELLAFIIAAI